MKNLFVILFVVFSSVVFSQSVGEMKMIIEINKIRKDPKSYIPVVESFIKKMETIIVFLESSNMDGEITSYRVKISDGKETPIDTLKSNDYISGYYELIKESKLLIKELSQTKSMDTLIFNPILYSITKSQGDYLKSINKITHRGQEGEPYINRFKKIGNVCENVCENTNLYNFDVLFMFMLDSGVSNKGHRKNILNPNIKQVSVYINDFCVLQNFME